MKKINRILSSIVMTALFTAMIAPFTDAGFLGIALSFTGIGFLIGVAKAVFNFSTDANRGFAYDFVVSDTTYAGEAAGEFITKAILGNETVQNGHVYVKDGVKKKFTIPRWDMNYTDLIQDRVATPVAGADSTVDGKLLTTEDILIFKLFNPRDFEDHYYASQLQGETLVDTTLPATVENVVTMGVMTRVGKYLNELYWIGSKALSATSPFKYIDGYKTKATASSSTLKVGSPTTLSAANIVTELTKGFALIPDALKYDQDMKIFMNYKTYDFYMQYQIAQANKGVDVTSQGVPTFRGLKVCKISGIPDDYYMIAKGAPDMSSNLWVACNSTQDEVELTIQRYRPESELYFIKGLLKVDVQIGWNEETVTYE